MSNANPHALTITETAAMLGLSETSVRRRLKDGSLHGTQIGARWIIGKDAVKAMLAVPMKPAEPALVVPDWVIDALALRVMERMRDAIDDAFNDAIGLMELAADRHESAA